MAKPVRRIFNESMLEAFGEALHDEYKKIFTTMFASQNTITARELSWMDKRIRTLDANLKILSDHMTKTEDENDEYTGKTKTDE